MIPIQSENARRAIYVGYQMALPASITLLREGL